MRGATAPPPAPADEGRAFLRQAIPAAAAVQAADRLGVLARLGQGPADPATLARDCAIGERGAQLLLAALAGLGLARRSSDGRYCSAPDQRGLHTLSTRWDQLLEALRDDRPAVAADTPEGAASYYPDVVPDLGAQLTRAAERAAGHLSYALSDAGQAAPALKGGRGDPVGPARHGGAPAWPGLRVLDVGAGAAPWSLALAARDPTLRITAVDLPTVIPATRRAVAAAGRSPQFRYLEGDLFTASLGRSRYDLAIAGNLCHLFDEAANRRLLGRLFTAVRPGGSLAVVDALPNEGLDGPRPVVLYALGLLLRTSHGRVYPFSTYVGWLRDAGYETVERVDLGPVMTLITARRPGRRVAAVSPQREPRGRRT